MKKPVNFPIPDSFMTKERVKEFLTENGYEYPFEDFSFTTDNKILVVTIIIDEDLHHYDKEFIPMDEFLDYFCE